MCLGRDFYYSFLVRREKKLIAKGRHVHTFLENLNACRKCSFFPLLGMRLGDFLNSCSIVHHNLTLTLAHVLM